MKRPLLEALLAARAAGTPTVLATHLPGGEQALMLGERIVGALALDAETLAQARRALCADRSTTVPAGDARIFLHVFNPPPRLIVVGAVHIALPLSQMAASTGYAVVVVDPRRAFARRDAFAGFTVVGDWPDAALAGLALDARSAVITLTHDPKLDDAALLVALQSPAFYIGCLGSQKTHAQRLQRLRLAGVPDDALGRIHAPIGLAIGAQTPAEIAIAILAEITQVRRRGERG